MFNRQGHYPLSQETEPTRWLQAQFHRETADATAPTPCPKPDLFWAAQEGELDRPTTDQLIDHTSQCPACAQAWRLARHLREERKQRLQPGRIIAFPISRKTRPAMALMAAAAAVVLVMLLGVPGNDPKTSYRDGATSPIVSLLNDDVPLDRADCTLQWEAAQAPEGCSYQLRVTAGDTMSRIVTKDGLTNSRWQIPASRLTDLPSDTQLQWHVTLVTADGVSQRSQTFTNLLR